LPAVADVSVFPLAGELSALPAAELAARLAEAYRVTGELTVQAEQLAAVNERLTARVEELERQVRGDPASSPRPPSSDSPYMTPAHRNAKPQLTATGKSPARLTAHQR
jgi:hypothetical protein